MTKLLLFPDINTSPSLTATPNCTCNEMIWEEGRSFADGEYDFSNLEFFCESLPTGKMTDFAVTDIGAPIVSERLKRLLDELGVHAQYFPVKIIEEKGNLPLTGYHAMNIIGMVNCIDFDASDLDVKERNGEIYYISEVRTLKLDERDYGEIYRIYYYERVIVLERYLAEKLNELNISGMKLIKPEKWDGIASEKDE